LDQRGHVVGVLLDGFHELQPVLRIFQRPGAECSEKPLIEASGVRSSCDTFATNPAALVPSAAAA